MISFRDLFIFKIEPEIDARIRFEIREFLFSFYLLDPRLHVVSECLINGRQSFVTLQNASKPARHVGLQAIDLFINGMVVHIAYEFS